MRRPVVLAALIAAIATPALAAPMQFDLVCTGKLNSNGAPWASRISVDLDRAAYCEAPCTTPKPIVGIDPGMIHFRLDPEAFFVNRTSGGVFKHVPGDYALGDCERAAFTPFPTVRF